MIEVKEKKNRHKPGGQKYIESAGELVYAPIVDGKELSMLAETADMALLLGLGYKHDGPNSQFAKMAARMLHMDTVWIA